MEEIPRARRGGMLSPLAPLNIRFAFEHICDRFLRAMMMNPCPRPGLN